MTVDPKSFWNVKILGWEDSRYGAAAPGPIERLAGTASSSLRFRLDVAVVADLAPQGDALIVSLGLVVWRTAADRHRLFPLGRQGSCLHAVSERRVSARQLVHRAYVHLSYGRKTGGYVPRYCEMADIAA